MRFLAVFSSARSTHPCDSSLKAAVNSASVLKLMASQDLCQKVWEWRKYPPTSRFHRTPGLKVNFVQNGN
jgi:hypothetical protein